MTSHKLTPYVPGDRAWTFRDADDFYTGLSPIVEVEVLEVHLDDRALTASTYTVISDGDIHEFKAWHMDLHPSTDSARKQAVNHIECARKDAAMRLKRLEEYVESLSTYTDEVKYESRLDRNFMGMKGGRGICATEGTPS